MVRYEGKALFYQRRRLFSAGDSSLVFSARLTRLSDALNNRCRPPFLADGDWVIAARRHGYDDLQALYNVSDGSVYLKIAPFIPAISRWHQFIKSRTASYS